MPDQHLVQILLSKSRGDGAPVAREWFKDFLGELSERFGGVTSFLRAPGEGLWEDGNTTEQEDVVVVEVMTRDFEETYWTVLKQRLERELDQEEIVIRTSQILKL